MRWVMAGVSLEWRIGDGSSRRDIVWSTAEASVNVARAGMAGEFILWSMMLEDNRGRQMSVTVPLLSVSVADDGNDDSLARETIFCTAPLIWSDNRGMRNSTMLIDDLGCHRPFASLLVGCVLPSKLASVASVGVGEEEGSAGSTRTREVIAVWLSDIDPRPGSPHVKCEWRSTGHFLQTKEHERAVSDIDSACQALLLSTNPCRCCPHSATQDGPASIVLRHSPQCHFDGNWYPARSQVSILDTMPVDKPHRRAVSNSFAASTMPRWCLVRIQGQS